ncbi:MAG: divalent-cation tolerance protein CutA [Candidatus Diapherotrites archaeon]|nr:divalent-cation tolerance protein CutA [Candidatus Diapherotrites archaeon]
MGTAAGFVTCVNAAEARKIAKALLRKRLVACANIVPKIESHYWWNGKIEKGSEALLIIKTRKSLMKKIIKEIKALHSYELPVIEFFDSTMNKEAAAWIERETIE